MESGRGPVFANTLSWCVGLAPANDFLWWGRFKVEEDASLNGELVAQGLRVHRLGRCCPLTVR